MLLFCRPVSRPSTTLSRAARRHPTACAAKTVRRPVRFLHADNVLYRSEIGLRPAHKNNTFYRRTASEQAALNARTFSMFFKIFILEKNNYKKKRRFKIAMFETFERRFDENRWNDYSVHIPYGIRVHACRTIVKITFCSRTLGTIDTNTNRSYRFYFRVGFRSNDDVWNSIINHELIMKSMFFSNGRGFSRKSLSEIRNF